MRVCIQKAFSQASHLPYENLAKPGKSVSPWSVRLRMPELQEYRKKESPVLYSLGKVGKITASLPMR